MAPIDRDDAPQRRQGIGLQESGRGERRELLRRRGAKAREPLGIEDQELTVLHPQHGRCRRRGGHQPLGQGKQDSTARSLLAQPGGGLLCARFAPARR